MVSFTSISQESAVNETGMSRPDTLQSVSTTTLRKYSANFHTHTVSDLYWGSPPSVSEDPRDRPWQGMSNTGSSLWPLS